VTGKSHAYEIYVPLPPNGDKGTILQLNSMSKLEGLCYNVGNMAMFMPEADLQGIDIVKRWHDDPKSRVTDPKEAADRPLAYVDSAVTSSPTSTCTGPPLQPQSVNRRRRGGDRRNGSRYGPLSRTAPLRWRMWNSLLRKSRV
jgi:hypothetical protein